MDSSYPILFQPLLKPRIWGGRRLARFGKSLPDEPAAIGESWELADLPPDIEGGHSIIANGGLAGLTLHQAIDEHRHAIMGSASLSPEGGFPLLIKYLDARENLSVQVHPTPEYAAEHAGCFVKSEAWVVVEAEPGSAIYKGLRPGVTPDRLRRQIQSGAIVDDLIPVPALPGDCHYLPSGTVHALGAGVLVAEVQTPSDTTFRLFDWGRSGRALHIEEALRCIDFAHGPEVAAQPRHRERRSVVTSEFTTETLCQAECFTIERIAAIAGADLPVVTNGSPVVWMVLSGAGSVRTSGTETVAFAAGSTMLMPAGIRASVARFHRPTTLLRILLPSPHRDLLA